MLKNLPASAGGAGDLWIMGQEDPLEEEMATHSSSLAWRIPWTEEPDGLQFRGLQRVKCMHTLYFPQLSGSIKSNPIGPQSQMPWRLIFPSAGSLGLHLELLILWEKLCTCNYSPVCVFPPWGMKLDYIVTLLLLPTLLWFLLYNFNYRRSPLVCSGLFHWWMFWR